MTPSAPKLPTRSERPSMWQRMSIVWLVPIAALLVTLWVAWTSYADRGPLIEIVFEQASGIHAGETELKFRDVTIGIVEKVGFSPTLDTVEVSVRLDKNVAEYADASSNFWIVQPEVTTQGVSGLDTVLSGVFIEVAWDADPQGLIRRHQGQSSAPLMRTGETGLSIRLTAGAGTQLASGTPIFHKGIAVGRVGKPNLSTDGSAARAEGVIFAPYDKLVSSTTRFWDTSGFRFSIGASGAELDFSSIASLIAGGAAFDTIVSGGTAVEDGVDFVLYADETSARSSLFDESSGPTLNLTAIFDENFSGLTVGAEVLLDGVRLGEVASLNGIVDEARFGDPKVRLSISMALQTSSFGLPEANAEAAIAFLQSRVDEGLRARLATASILTGGLKVELVTIPDAPPAVLDLEGDPFPIIPVAPAEISDVTATAEGVMERINKLPIEELLAAATGFLESATILASGEDIRSIPTDVRGLVGDMRGLVSSDDVKGLPGQAALLMDDLKEVTGALRKVATQIEEAQTVERLLAAVDAATEAAKGVDTSIEGVPALVARLTAVAEKAEGLELQALITELSDATKAAGTLLSDEGMKALPTRLGTALSEIEGTLSDLREGGTVDNLNASLESARNSMEAVELAAKDLPNIVKRLEAMAAQASSTLSGFDEDSELNRSARTALREVRDAARAIQQLARTLERRPNSVILGR